MPNKVKSIIKQVQAAEEMNIPVEEVRQMYKSNLQITAKSTGLLQIEDRKAG